MNFCSFSGDPHSDANAVGTDAFRTLFVGRIVCSAFPYFQATVALV